TPPAGSTEHRTPAKTAMYVSGFENMKRLAHRVALEGARVVVGGHSTVPFAARGEAPLREMELLVESGFTPLEVIQAATGTAAGFLYRDRDLGTLQPGKLADLVVLSGDPTRNIAEIRTVQREMTSDAEGNFELPNLRPGTYTVEARLAGFKTVKRVGVLLHAASVARADLQLELGRLEDVVTVTAEGQNNITLESQAISRGLD